MFLRFVSCGLSAGWSEARGSDPEGSIVRLSVPETRTIRCLCCHLSPCPAGCCSRRWLILNRVSIFRAVRDKDPDPVYSCRMHTTPTVVPALIGLRLQYHHAMWIEVPCDWGHIIGFRLHPHCPSLSVAPTTTALAVNPSSSPPDFTLHWPTLVAAGFPYMEIGYFSSFTP